MTRAQRRAAIDQVRAEVELATNLALRRYSYMFPTIAQRNSVDKYESG